MSDHHFAAQMFVSILTMFLRVWGAFGLPVATFLVTNWVRLYTHPAVCAVRSDRRNEISSDVAEQIVALRAEGYHPSEIGARLLVRMLLGIASDLSWMAVHLEVLQTVRHSRLAMEADLALFYLLRPWRKLRWRSGSG
jgi:hypothetical protein